MTAQRASGPYSPIVCPCPQAPESRQSLRSSRTGGCSRTNQQTGTPNLQNSLTSQVPCPCVVSRFRHIILYNAVMAPDGYATGKPCESRMKAVFERLTSKSGNRLHLLPPHGSLRMMTFRLWHTSYCPNQHMSVHHDHTLRKKNCLLV